MTPAEQDAIARQAGEETGECYPANTPWRRRFVELVEDHSPGATKMNAENAALREALSWYAETSNWRREVRNVGPRKAWKKPPVASDRGGMARLVLMTMEGTKQ